MIARPDGCRDTRPAPPSVPNSDLCHEIIEAQPAPDFAALAHSQPQRYPFLLESSAGAAAQSRYDLLLAFPGQTMTIDDGARADRLFETLSAAGQPSAPERDLPFIGGWFFYLGYEVAATVEPTLALPPSGDDGLPAAFATRCPAAIIHDRERGCLHLVSELDEPGRIEAMHADLRAYGGQALAVAPRPARWREQPPERYVEAVRRARELIHAGDVFQVNLSRAWQGELSDDAPPAAVYAALRGANPAPFSGLIQWQDAAIACSSPERLLSCRGGILQTRPIAGTRPRSGDDTAMVDELLAHPKERAEHVMLIDMERNDLGRVCRPGSIRVSELMVAESYAHVHHIVSNVLGCLRPDCGVGDAFRAVFPGGTITGCPKVRCMAIIAELEGEGRGPYTGTLGYVSRCGQVDSNIIIRSLAQRGRRLELRTGAGIVADSEPEAELAETRSKARGVLKGFVDARGQRYG